MPRLSMLLVSISVALAAVPFLQEQTLSDLIPQDGSQSVQPAQTLPHHHEDVVFRKSFRQGVPSAPRASQIADNTLQQVYKNTVNAAVRVNIVDAGLGSGFFLSSDGLVLTAAHVALGDPGAKITVTTYDRKTYPAELVGYDELKDLAILKVKGSNFPTLKLSNTLPKVGDGVVAIGNSRGAFVAARAGKVTGLNTTIDASFPSAMVSSSMPLAPGDSGGPVINARGEVVGVSTAIGVSAGQFSSFFVPLTTNSEIVAALKGGLKVGVPVMGVGVADASDFLDQSGVVITSVSPNSGAAQAGLRAPEISEFRDDSGMVQQQIGKADVIVGVDGRKVETTSDLISYLRSKKAGDEVTLKVNRDGKTVQLKVTLKDKQKL